MEKTLHLNVKQPWFSMEQSGEKKEEYRDIKDYWMKRFLALNQKGKKNAFWDRSHSLSFLSFRDFDLIHIKNGYARNGKPAPSFTRECEGIRIGIGRKEWGASGDNQFIIGLGEIVK